ncbi:MAG: hypothetical protein J6V87_04705 [Prevotella sp.]|nr:hypothetical protein [Prevotella sp.]
MKKLLTLVASVVLVACGSSTDDNPLTLTSKFDGTWNIHESFERNSDGTITYTSIPWGGLVGSMREHNLPVDWSDYESITVEFVEPVKAAVQLVVSGKLKMWGKPGVTSLTCYFDGQDVRNIDEVAIQSSEGEVLKIKQVFLTPGNSVWESTPIWNGTCIFGNWENGIEIPADRFTELKEGDKLEFIYEMDKSNPDVTYWQFKTIYSSTDKTLEGNNNELNNWGCANVGESGVYRIILTANDVKELKKHGLYANGYYNNVSQVNLVRKVTAPEKVQEGS